MPNTAISEICNTAGTRFTTHNHRGLITTEALKPLEQFGPNALAEEKAHPLKEFAKRFWAPVPWLLEATIILQVFLQENVEAAIVAGLLVLNATLSLVQEGRAQKPLVLLRQQLRVVASVRRDSIWTSLSAGALFHCRIVIFGKAPGNPRGVSS
jgi:H+-transporting ATPase